MKRFSITLAIAASAVPVAAFAQVPAEGSAAAVPAVLTVAEPVAAPTALALPANSEVLLSINDELSSKTVREGATFALSVVHDVTSGGYVVIPKGSKGVGEITWRTGKGAFGKSAKMEYELRYVELNGKRVPIEGKFREEGGGNTGAAIGAVVAVGVFGAFVTGKSAIVPRGRELMAHTKETLPYTAGEATPVAAPAVVAAPVVTPVAAPAPETTPIG